MLMPQVTKTIIRRGASHALGTIIDGYLDQREIAALYGKWKKSWAEPLGFRGGEKAITCEMILEVPEAEFISVYGKKLGNRLRQVAKLNAGR